MIKMKNIDENGNREIYFSRNDGSYRTLQPKTTWNSKVQDDYLFMDLFKICVNNRKYFRIVQIF